MGISEMKLAALFIALVQANDCTNLEWKVSENGWENDGKASECINLDADCSESKRDCCVKSDWTQLSDNVKEVETWSGQVDAGIENLLTDIDNYMTCITNRCYE